MVKIKKAQMKIQQTAFMLVAITLLFVLAGLFFFGFGLSKVKEDVTELKAKQAKLLVSKLANSPELSCGESFGEKKGDCIDTDKVIMLLENKSKYAEFWAVDDIKIRRIFPKMSSEIKCTLSSYPNCNAYNLIKEGVVGTYNSNFVSLCRKEASEGGFYNKCELGVLMISYVKVK